MIIQGGSRGTKFNLNTWGEKSKKFCVLSLQNSHMKAMILGGGGGGGQWPPPRHHLFLLHC